MHRRRHWYLYICCVTFLVFYFIEAHCVEVGWFFCKGFSNLTVLLLIQQLISFLKHKSRAVTRKPRNAAVNSDRYRVFRQLFVLFDTFSDKWHGLGSSLLMTTNSRNKYSVINFHANKICTSNYKKAELHVTEHSYSLFLLKKIPSSLHDCFQWRI